VRYTGTHFQNEWKIAKIGQTAKTVKLLLFGKPSFLVGEAAPQEASPSPVPIANRAVKVEKGGKKSAEKASKPKQDFSSSSDDEDDSVAAALARAKAARAAKANREGGASGASQIKPLVARQKSEMESDEKKTEPKSPVKSPKNELDSPKKKKKPSLKTQELVVPWKLPLFKSARLHISNIHADVKEKQLKGILTRFGKLTQFQLTVGNGRQIVEASHPCILCP